MKEEDEPVDADEEELSAFLDGELDPERTRQVEAKASHDSETRRKLDAYKRTWYLLDNLPQAEPSPNFTERTVSRIEPIRPVPASLSGTTVAQSSPQTAPAVFPPRRPAWVWPAAILGGLLIGYLGRAVLVNGRDREDVERDTQIVKELRILENLHLFRYADDLELLKTLADPDYFGEEPRE